jgi:hypothetical protein
MSALDREAMPKMQPRRPLLGRLSSPQREASILEVNISAPPLTPTMETQQTRDDAERICRETRGHQASYPAKYRKTSAIADSAYTMYDGRS